VVGVDDGLGEGPVVCAFALPIMPNWAAPTPRAAAPAVPRNRRRSWLISWALCSCPLVHLLASLIELTWPWDYDRFPGRLAAPGQTLADALVVPRGTIRVVSPLDMLVSRLPDGTVRTDEQIRRERAIDSWALALLRRVQGDELDIPAAVIFPASTEEVTTVLAWASQTSTAVIPRGAGSGVCGGAQATAGSVVLDLSRLDQITDIDLVSQAVSVQAGVRGDQLERALAEHGLTAGLYPQSIAISTVGGWIAASSAGQASTGFGAIEDVLLGLTAVLPQGEIMRCRPVPRSAAGPDLRRLLIGSEGTLAVVTEATLACRARPAGWDWLAFAFPDFAALADGLRQAVRADTGAAVIRGYDETDAQLSFGALGHPGGCVGMLGFPAGRPGLAARKQAAAEAMPGVSGDLGARYGEHWWDHRNDAVQTYAQIMGPERAFGSGVVVDTFEVAGLWSAVPRLYTGIRAALAGHAQAVGCHLSHLYPSGSSLYFTFLISGADDRDAAARYLAAWDQAVRSCADMGGTITHHHGVGRLKAGHLAGDLGETGVDVLARIKAALDPAGIMNPHVLLP
jgi:alkyldihydroxyacetonephosphate synthase